MNLEEIQMTCEAHLELISKNFTPDCKITLVVRKPENDEADFILSNDSKEEIIKVIERRL